MKKTLLIILLLIMMCLSYKAFALMAQINSFDIDEKSVNTAFTGRPTLQVTGVFRGTNVDTWEMTLQCPLPITIDGFFERIDLIRNGGKGITAPSKEGEGCNITQPASGDVKSISYLVVNPFNTPQSVSLELRAYQWNGKENILGEKRTKSVIVEPTFSGAPQIPKSKISINNITADKTILESGEKMTLSWSATGAYKYDVAFSCQDGLSILSDQEVDFCEDVTNGWLEVGGDTSISATVLNSTNKQLSFAFTLVAYSEDGRFSDMRSYSSYNDPSDIYINPKTQSGPSSSISNFLSQADSISSGDRIVLSWEGENVDNYKLKFNCSNNIVIDYEKQNVCNEMVDLGSYKSFSGLVYNNSEDVGEVIVALMAYQALAEKPDQQINRTIIINK